MARKNGFAANFDVDLSPFFYLAYCSPKASSQAIADLESNKSSDEAIARGLSSVVPALDNLLRFSHRYISPSPKDSETLVKSFLLKEPYGFSFYDLGSLDGERAKRICTHFNEIKHHKSQEIRQISLVDMNEQYLTIGAANLRGSFSTIQILTDFNELTTPPPYIETDEAGIEHCRVTGEEYVATCKTNLERKILFLGGRTLNNLHDPFQLIRHLSNQMNDLDMMLLEYRHKGDYSDYPEKPREFVYDYLDFIGFSGEYTDNMGNVVAENTDRRIYSFTLAKPYDVVSSNPLCQRHPQFKEGARFSEGTTFLIGFNRPIPFGRIANFCYHEVSTGLSPIALEDTGKDMILFLSKVYEPSLYDRKDYIHADGCRLLFSPFWKRFA